LRVRADRVCVRAAFVGLANVSGGKLRGVIGPCSATHSVALL
jgi:hypothetical protein